MNYKAAARSRRLRRNVCKTLGVVAVGAVIAMILVWRSGNGRAAMPYITTASTCYLLIALIAGGLRSSNGRLVTAGLLFCWLGDMIGPRNFLAGLGAFLVAHLALIIAFALRGLSRTRMLYSSTVVAVAGACVLLWLYPHVPHHERVAIFGYMAVISAMALFAGGCKAEQDRPLILAAAVLFYVSDLFLARSRFVSPDFINTELGYPMYYAACLLFAFSILSYQESQAIRVTAKTC